MTSNPAIDFQALFNTMPGNFLVLKPNPPYYTILAISDDLLHITSKQREAVVGKSIFEVYPENPKAITPTGPSTLKVSLQHVIQLKATHQMPVVRYDIADAAGVFETRYWSVNNRPVLDQAGEVLYIIHSSSDISEQVKAEKQKRALREIESTQNLFLQAPVAVCIVTGPENIVELANAETLRFMGRTSDIIGKPLFESLPEAQEQGFPELLDQVRKTGKPIHATEHPTTLIIDGKEELRYYNFVYQPYYANPGDKDAAGVFSLAHDVTEQVSSRKRLEEAAQEMSNLANAMPQIVWIADSNGQVIHYNDRVAEFAGAKKMADGTWSWEGILIPEDIQPTVEAWTKAVQEGGVYEKEHRLKMKDGTYRWHLSRAFPQRDDKGHIVKWYGTATNVHAQKENAEALRQSEEQLRIALEAADLGTFNYDAQTEQVLWSAKTKEIFGLPADAEIHRETLFQRVHPDDRERSHATLLAAFSPESGGLYENEYRIINMANAELRWIRSKGKVSFDKQGKAIRFTGVTQNITARKQAEVALRESEARLKAMIEATPECIKIVSPDGTLQFMNSAGLDMIEGKSALLGKACVYNLIAQKDRKTWMENHQRICKGESLSWEFDIISLQGARRRLETHAVPLPSGGELFQLAVTRDITARKRAEEVLESKNRQLIQINNDLDNFVYTASHDLKTPIANIEGLLLALLRTLPAESLASERAQHITTMMQESIDRFKKTITHLTEVVKLQKENNEIAVVVELAPVVREVLLDLEPLIQAADLQLQIDIAECPCIRFSEKNLRSVIYNLLSNAIKYRSPDRVPQVQIRCENTSAYHVLIVTDNGLGMEAKRIGQLFTMFKRFHNHVEGTGIGLYMVKKMVENAGGRIEVESQENKGTTFRVYFKH